MRTNRLEAALRTIAVDLDGCGKPWALIGGLAVSARAEPRTTRDVDIAVAVQGDDEAERLVFELRNRGYELVTLIEQRAAERLATVRLQPPMEGLRKPLAIFCSRLRVSSRRSSAAQRGFRSCPGWWSRSRRLRISLL